METELKFALSPEAAQQVRSQWLQDSAAEEIVSTYFDTPKLDLQRAGGTLRLRHQGDRWVQTLKTGSGGAVARFEDERPAPDGRLAPEAFDAPALDALLNGARAKLQPVFESRVMRSTFDIVEGDARIEAALDEGSLQGGEATAPILEFELELKSGAPSDLFALGRRVIGTAGARLSLTSKAERGYRLASGSDASAVTFTPPSLDMRGDAAAGFHAVALAALHQLAANAERLREVASPEAVHQARVALRRMRTFVKAFKALVRDEQADEVSATLKRLTAVFEDARALDVFQSEAFMPSARREDGAAPLGHAILAARARAYEGLQVAIAAPAFARDLFDLVEWTVCGPWVEALAQRTDRPPRLEPVAQQILKQSWKTMRRRAAKLDWSDARARHKLRIQGKQLRYLLESLAEPKAAKRPLKRLKTLQTQLGVLNDIATAHQTVSLAFAGASPQAAFAAGCIVGERRAGVRDRIKAARRAHHRLASHLDGMAKSDWRKLPKR